MQLRPKPHWWSTSICVLGVLFLALLPLLGLLHGAFQAEHQTLLNASTSFIDFWQRYELPLLTLKTFLLGFVVSTISVVIGGCIAWMSQRYYFPGRKILTIICLLPLAIPSYILAATLRNSLSPGSFIGATFNLPIFNGFIPACIVLTIITIPYVQLLLSSRLNTLDCQQEEAAARTLGANSWQIFRKITWGYLKPAIFGSWLVTFLYVISDFGAVAVLNYPVLTWRLYQAVEFQQLILASLLGSALLIITLPVLFIQRFLQTPKTSQNGQQSLAWITLAMPKLFYPLPYLLYSSIIIIGVILPITTLCNWVYHGINMNLFFADISTPLLATLFLAFSGGIFITVIAYGFAWVTGRGIRLIDDFIEQMIYLTGGLPNILLAFGLLLAALSLAKIFNVTYIYHFLLATGILLIFGYTLRFLPQSYLCFKTAFATLDEKQYASAKLLGASSRYWWTRLALPHLMPSIRASLLIVVLAIGKELPITLLLGNATGLQPLSVRMFDRYQEAFLLDAGLAGLVLIIFCLILTFLTLRWNTYAN